MTREDVSRCVEGLGVLMDHVGAGLPVDRTHLTETELRLLTLAERIAKRLAELAAADPRPAKRRRAKPTRLTQPLDPRVARIVDSASRDKRSAAAKDRRAAFKTIDGGR